MNMQKGVALYLIIMITSIGLAIALGVADIVFLESRVTRGLLPSFGAFFAADTGVECASYWDIQQDFFNSGFIPGSPITCNNSAVSVSHTQTAGASPINGNIDKYNFSFDYPDALLNPFCVSVTVAKANVTIHDPIDGPIATDCTSIRSSGQNKACSGAIVDGTLERTLLVQSPENCGFDF